MRYAHLLRDGRSAVDARLRCECPERLGESALSQDVPCGPPGVGVKHS
jgi:hypothetical protein